jgi:hypothetical protein
MKILLADDEPGVVRLYRQTFEANGSTSIPS